MKLDFRAIIFDMDGTMVDNMAVHNRIWIAFFAEMGIELDAGSFHERTAGRTNPEVLRLFLGDDLSAGQLAELGEQKELRYRDYFRQHAQPVAGLRELLNAARQAGVKLGVATAAPPANVAFTLECLGLTGFFDAVVNGQEVQNGKPDPEIFLMTAGRLGVAPKDCLVFEDARMGIEAARRAGMPAMLVTTSILAEEGCQLPGVIGTLSDFIEVLELLF
jgi:beta-phosphoglucomutase family hydrolase